MSTNDDATQVEDCLAQLKCHFTWKLAIEETEMPDLESRILEEIGFLDTRYNVGIHNLLAYVEHLKGQNDKALQSLRDAESLIQREHTDQSDTKSLVTWGNYAWLCYHLGRLADAKMYLDKVENTCKKLSSPFRFQMECPEMDCEEGWALLKCGEQNYERALACFQSALEMEPENPEFNTGYAITFYRLDYCKKLFKNEKAPSLGSLRKAVRLNPEDAYIKVLLALRLQDVGQETEGKIYIEEALSHKSSQIYIFRYVAMFYRKAGYVDKALEFLQEALQAMPNSTVLNHQIGLCYKKKLVQVRKAAKMQPTGRDREEMDRYARLAILHFKHTVKQKPTFHIALLHLALVYIESGKYEEAEDSFQKLFSMTPPEEMLQKTHFHYGTFQEYQKKSSADAIQHYLKATQIGDSSFITKKCISSLHKLASRKLQRNKFDKEGLRLLEYIRDLEAKMSKAAGHHEQAESLAPGPGSESAMGSDV